MNKLLTSITLALLLSIIACNESPKMTIPQGPKTWVFNITPQTSIHDIDSVTLAWKKDSIALKFTKLEFTDAGKLIKIKGAMNIMPKGTPGGTFTSDSLSSYKLEVDNRESISISGK